MHILFIHRAFPAQFGRLALELTRRYGWKCSFLIEHLSRCPSPSREMLGQMDLHQFALGPEMRPNEMVPWPQAYGQWLDVARAVCEAARARPGPRPDLVVGHGGLAPTLFPREVLDCPIVDYCEYYFARQRSDLTYRLDLPPTEPAPFYPRCINAATLVNLVECDAGYTATRWQRQSFPPRFRPKIEDHYDGIDTELYRPRQLARVIGDRSIPAGTRVVTFVARGLESVRGFDLFMRLARRIARERSDVLFVIVGDEGSYYGWDRVFTGGQSFKQWLLRHADHDLSRFLFLGHVEPERLADLLCLSDMHLCLTVPFVLSWSLLDALACGCVVLAGDVPPVREVIEPGHNGLVEPLFDAERLAQTALRVLDEPAAFQPLRQAARAAVEEKYSLDVALPGLTQFFERVAARAEPEKQVETQAAYN